jgi:aspartate carbamoyltransferase catalytic subunit
MRHLLSIQDLDRDAIEQLLERAASFADYSERDINKVPALRGRLVVNLFYEASTRTRSSFELAAKRLSADVLNFASSGSSVEKGESLKDTVATLSAYGPDALVVRAPYVGAAQLVTGWTPAAVINAGDGTHEHPTQALLDVYTLTRRLGSLEGRSIWIVGDVLHSRVARSNILAFTRMGAAVTVCGPPTLIPRGIEALGCEVRHNLDELRDADVVYALRMQHERMRASYVPSLREYTSTYQIDARRLGPRQLLMHPGPVNRGVELASEVVDSPQALITSQVQAGVWVRMAVLYELLAGRGPRTPGAVEAKPAEERVPSPGAAAARPETPVVMPRGAA